MVVSRLHAQDSLYVPTSEFAQLAKRFAVADTTLTFSQIQKIYYGFSSQPTYNPEKFIPVENRIRDFNSSGKPAEAIELADSLLAVYPVSLVALFEKAYAYYQTSNEGEEWKDNIKYQALLRVVEASGDGNSPETAFRIISPNDEFEIIRDLGLTATRYEEIAYKGKIYDVLELKKNKLKMPRVFFDITLPAKQKEKVELQKLKEERK